MASTPAGALLTETHRITQARLVRELTNRLALIWSVFELANPAATWPALSSLVLPILRDARAQSTQISAEYFTEFRAAERVAGTAAPVLAAMPSDEQLLARARTLLVPASAPVLPPGMKMYLPSQRSIEAAFSNLAGEASRQAQNGGRSTIDQSVQADRQAIGWCRVTDANPCSFCAMLASRGPVYKSRKSTVAGSKWSERVGGYRAHAHCGCTAEPIYRDDAEWPGRAREFADLWQETAQQTETSAEARLAFRRVLEGR